MITNLLFDLDNTLYCATSPINENMFKRMMVFISEFLNLSYEKAVELSTRIHPYSTTLEWLRAEYNFTDTEAYFRTLHPEDEKNEVIFDPKLRPFLQKLGKTHHLSVLTNSAKIHAEQILNHLNVYDLFDGIFDIETNNLKGKPYPDSYLNAITEKGFTVKQTLFFDDYPKYIKGFNDIGGRGVLVDKTGRFKDNPLLEETPLARISTVYEIPTLLKKIEQGLL